jgi:hypothetical protein
LNRKRPSADEAPRNSCGLGTFSRARCSPKETVLPDRVPAHGKRRGGRSHEREAGSASRTIRTRECEDNRPARPAKKETGMLKFIGGTVGVIFLIGLLVVIGLLALIF